MRSAYIAASGCLLTLVSAASCKANNCLRAVKASAFPTRSADCSSYFLTTVTPAASTVYVTVVVTTLPTNAGSPVGGNATPITVSPTSVPTYASACSGSAKYSSACSCIGASKRTTTVAAPSTTIYITQCALPSPEPEVCNSVLMGDNSRNYQVQCGLEYSGESSLFTTTVASYQDCFKACDSNPNCGSFTFLSTQCSDNCKLFGFYDTKTVETNLMANSGFTPGTARDGTCGMGICGEAVLGNTLNQDSYLVACRSSYSFTQAGGISGSPFTATSFLDCLGQCNGIHDCNYMSFDSSKFTGNCAMFSGSGSQDTLSINPYIDSAKALVQAEGPPGISLLADRSQCPVYDGSGGCVDGPGKTPIHKTIYTYTATCGKRYEIANPDGEPVTVSTLTVNTFAQCFDACDKNDQCYFMNFAASSISTVDNCQFLSSSNVKSTINPNYDSVFY